MNVPSAPTWLLLQLADGTFPSGGFAHSFGLEAAVAFDGVGARPSVSGAGASVSGARAEGTFIPVGRFLEHVLDQTGRAALPFVGAACAAPDRLAALDAAYDATVPMLVPNRASRAQGRALVSAASRIWDDEAVARIAAHAREHAGHHAVVFGALFGALGLSQRDTLATYLHATARGVLSAAVRLGLIGPLAAQRLHAETAPSLDGILARAITLDVEDAAQTAPLVELYAALHDQLDARMFQS